MNKVWIVEETRNDGTSAILDVHKSLESAKASVLDWEKYDDDSVQFYTVTVMKLQGEK